MIPYTYENDSLFSILTQRIFFISFVLRKF